MSLPIAGSGKSSCDGSRRSGVPLLPSQMTTRSHTDGEVSACKRREERSVQHQIHRERMLTATRRSLACPRLKPYQSLSLLCPRPQHGVRSWHRICVVLTLNSPRIRRRSDLPDVFRLLSRLYTFSVTAMKESGDITLQILFSWLPFRLGDSTVPLRP